MRFKGRVALITGSSRGIGRETAMAFAREGARVIVTYRREGEKAASIAQEIVQSGGYAVAEQVDVTDQNSVAQLVHRLTNRWGNIDILVNNAGIIRRGSFLEDQSGSWRAVLDVNLVGTFICTKAIAPAMPQGRGGKIINVSSIRGLLQCGGESVMAYNASKAAVNSLTRTLAKELAPLVNVNAVLPGFTRTEMTTTISSEAILRSVAEQSCLGRWAEPAEIANGILFLASDAASFITGHLLVIDGGFSLKEDFALRNLMAC